MIGLPLLLMWAVPNAQAKLPPEYAETVAKLRGLGAEVRIELSEDRRNSEAWVDVNGPVSTELLKTLSELKPMTALRLLQSNIDDKGLALIHNLPRLWLLVVISHKVTDSGVGSIAKLSALKKLDLNRMRLGVEGIEPLTKLKKLEQLYLYNSLVTDEALLRLKRLSWLKLLDLHPKTSDSVLSELRRALPHTKVERGP